LGVDSYLIFYSALALRFGFEGKDVGGSDKINKELFFQTTEVFLLVFNLSISLMARMWKLPFSIFFVPIY